MKIIGIGHYSRVGKDSFANYLLAALQGTAAGKLKISDAVMLKSGKLSLAWKLKQICYELYAWAGVQPPEHYETPEGAKERDIILPALGMTPVQLWVKFGTPAVREQVYDRTWIDFILKNDHGLDVLIVPDVRFPNETEAFKEAGATLIKIVRPGFGPRDTVADKALMGWDGWDYVWGGSGEMAELERHAQQIANWVNGTGPQPYQTPEERAACLAVEVLPAVTPAVAVTPVAPVVEKRTLKDKFLDYVPTWLGGN